MTAELVVPSEIEQVIQQYEKLEEPFVEHDVQSSLNKARKALNKPSDAENLGAWAEVLAVMALLETSAPDRAAFVSAAAAGAPDDLLDRFGLPGTRDPDRVFRKLKVPARMRAPAERPRVIDRIRARYRDGS